METVYRNDTNEVLYTDMRAKSMKHATTWEEELAESLPFWDFRFRQYYSDGIHIGACHANIHENIRISTSEQAPMPGLAFVQQGELTTTSFAGDGPRHFTARQHNLFLNPYSAEATVFKKQQDLRVFLVTFLPERFLELAENAGPAMEKMANSIAGKTGEPFQQKENLPITPRMQTLITEMIQCNYQGGWRNLFMQAKALELLALQCQQLEATAEKRSTLRAADINKIHQVREALLLDVQNPPSLASLARQAGLNEHKLKAGFKEVYGHTVFGYLKDHRLTLARQLILEGGKTITEVAYETGYTTLQHFSNEFRRKFGQSPGQMRRFF